MQSIRTAEAKLFTDRVTRGQLNKRDEALQLFLPKHRSDVFLDAGASAGAHDGLPLALPDLIGAVTRTPDEIIQYACKTWTILANSFLMFL